MLANRYKEQLESGIEARKTQLDFIKEDPKRQADNPDRLELNFGYSLKINKAASWDFPVLKYKQNNEVHVSKYESLSLAPQPVRWLTAHQGSVYRPVGLLSQPLNQPGTDERE